MGKKFCYSELTAVTQTAPRIENGSSCRQGGRDQKDQDADEEEDGKSGNPPQRKEVLGNLANGYLTLVHHVQANLCPPPTSVVKAEEKKREVGGEIPESPRTEEEISESSEDNTGPKIGFVHLFRRSRHFECLGIPVTPLEIFSMECQKEDEPKERVLGGVSKTELDGCDNQKEFQRSLSKTKNLSTPRAMEKLQNIRCPDERKERKVELEWKLRKFPSGVLKKYPHPSPSNRLPIKRSSQNQAERHVPYFKSASSSFQVPEKSPSQNSYGELPAQNSVTFSEQSSSHYPIKTRIPAKFPVQCTSKFQRQPPPTFVSRQSSKIKFPSTDIQNSLPRRNWKFNDRGSREPNVCEKSFRKPIEVEGSKKYLSNTKRKVSKMSFCPRFTPFLPETKLRRTTQKNSFKNQKAIPKDLTWKTILAPRPFEDFCSSGSEEMPSRTHMVRFKETKTIDPVNSSRLEMTHKRWMDLLKCEPKKSCLKESGVGLNKPYSEPLVPLHSNVTFTEVWKRSGLSKVNKKHEVRFGGLYSRADKLKFQPIDRLDAGCGGKPIFAESKKVLERIQYFASAFDQQSHTERMQDIELRMCQLRVLQATSDQEYHRHFMQQKRFCKPVLINSTKCVCPLDHDDCSLVTNATLLRHFVTQHLNESEIELREIFEGDRVLSIFDPKAFLLGKNDCMSVLLYGGVRNEPSTLPVARFMPTENIHLPEDYAHFSGHLPLFVMICRNRMSSVEGKRVRFEGLDDEEVLVLWMASMDLPHPIHVMMTVLNRRLDFTKTAIMKVRGIHKSHDCLDFMRSSRQYMRLCDQDLRVLTNDHTEPLYMELSVKEYAGIFPCQD
ncbi:uncharacterized protein LOC108098151 [Drosophila ficusphila]|uniref:uncharacterized protein LOC108098151 n=1 Tax=Drosophila ficusphila TaxID=30025 RepID=UPI0007E64010|nr:uncharacterized protein LOC108098151 [Drosophila ficusphila]